MTNLNIDDFRLLLDFHYNGDLGALQHKAVAFNDMLQTLLSLGQLSKAQYDELRQQLIEHFKSGLQDAIDNAFLYIR